MDYIDTRDLVTKRDELRAELEENAELPDNDPMKLGPQGIEVVENEIAEIDDVEGYCEDFIHGATLIPESDFEEYAQEFAEDIGAIDRDAAWPLGCIDWKQAASELATDYTLVSYQGQSYFVR